MAYMFPGYGNPRPNYWSKKYILQGLGVTDPLRQSQRWQQWKSQITQQCEDLGIYELNAERDGPLLTSNIAIIAQEFRGILHRQGLLANVPDDWIEDCTRATARYFAYIGRRKASKETQKTASTGKGSYPKATTATRNQPEVAPKQPRRRANVNPHTYNHSVDTDGIEVHRRQPDGQEWRAYSANTLRALTGGEDYSLPVLLQLLREDTLLKDHSDELVYGPLNAPVPVRKQRHFNDGLAWMQAQRMLIPVFWVRVPEPSVPVLCVRIPESSATGPRATEPTPATHLTPYNPHLLQYQGLQQMATRFDHQDAHSLLDQSVGALRPLRLATVKQGIPTPIEVTVTSPSFANRSASVGEFEVTQLGAMIESRITYRTQLPSEETVRDQQMEGSFAGVGRQDKNELEHC
ncbi:MAG: hypothetical protein Q9208_008145 [Pyrenodesmia sp. 3 TL-2023]